MKLEYKLREVTRYVVTRYYEDDSGLGASHSKGEYSDKRTAYEVAYALCKADHERFGIPPHDNRVQYPEMVGVENPGAVMIGEPSAADA